MDWSLRLATPADAERLAANVTRGLRVLPQLRAARAGRPPSADGRAGAAGRRRSARDDVWCLLAEARRRAGRPRGHPPRRDRARRLARARARPLLAAVRQAAPGTAPGWRWSCTTRRSARRASAASRRCACTPRRARPGRGASTSARAGWPRGRRSTCPASGCRSSSTGGRSAAACDRAAPGAGVSRAGRGRAARAAPARGRRRQP